MLILRTFCPFFVFLFVKYLCLPERRFVIGYIYKKEDCDCRYCLYCRRRKCRALRCCCLEDKIRTRSPVLNENDKEIYAVPPLFPLKAQTTTSALSTMYRNRRQHQKCNASTPTKPILHEKCDYHGKDEYSHVFYVSVWSVDISYCNTLDYMI